MMHNKFQQILNNIDDPRQKQIIEGIINGKIVKNIKCKSKVCKDRLVAQINSDGSINPITDKEGVMWLLAYRRRLDGFLGFQCLCGNDSRLCEQEKGVSGIEQNSVTKEDLESVANNLEKKPAKYDIVNGKQIVDNFLIENI